MKNVLKTCALGSYIALALILGASQAWAQKPIKGNGTPEQIVKWTGADTIGDSVITEQNGNIGVGTATPGSKLTVAGRIEAFVMGISAGMLGQSSAGSGVRGNSDTGFGVFGSSDTGEGTRGTSNAGNGVFGFSVNSNGVVGQTNSGGSNGVAGFNTANGNGVLGQALNGTGVRGISASGFGLWGTSTTFTAVQAQSDTGYGVFGSSNTNRGVWGQSGTHDGVTGLSGGVGRSGVYGVNTNSAGFGVFGRNEGNNNLGYLGGDVGAFGFSSSGDGVRGQTVSGLAGNFIGSVNITGALGVGGFSSGAKLTAAGIIQSTTGGFKFPDGTIQTTASLGGLGMVVHDSTLNGDGTAGTPLRVNVPLHLNGAGTEVVFAKNSGTGDGVAAFGGNGSPSGGAGLAALGGLGIGPAQGGTGVVAIGGTSDNGIGGGGLVVFGGQGVPNGFAGLFIGDVTVSGNLSKSGGSFKIDHPLDPANKYLSHSFVESPDMMNVYNGNAITDANGEAMVALPDYCEALNRDFRYQLTVIGQFAQAIVGSEISGNRFTIKTDRPGVKVSWQVTGIRQDAWANQHRIAVEQEKSEEERGYYLHPQLYSQPEEKSVEWVHHPELMQRMREQHKRLR